MSRGGLNVNFGFELCNEITFQNSSTENFVRCWCQNLPLKFVCWIGVEVSGGIRAIFGRGVVFIPSNAGDPVGFSDVFLTT